MKPALVIIGGSTVEHRPDATWATKRPLAEYVHELARGFGSCTWICTTHQAIGTAGVIDPSIVTVVPLVGGRAAYPIWWWQTIHHLRHASYVIGFLPALLPLLPIVPLIRRRARRFLVYLAGDYAMQIDALRRDQHEIRSQMYQLGFEYPMRVADVVVARGSHLAGLARHLNTNVSLTVPIAHMDLTHFARPVERQQGEILYMGKLLRSKGVGDLLDAVAMLGRRMSVRLRLVGSGPDRDELVAQAIRLGLADTVDFLGWMDDPTSIAAAIQQASVVAVPSSDHPEGVPRVIDEALSLGCPVVATATGGIPDEFSRGEVLLVKGGDTEALSDGLQEALSNQDVRLRSLEAAARRMHGPVRFTSAADQHMRLLLNESRHGRAESEV